MGQLELLLDKVRQADLTEFRNKVESMEAPHEQLRSELGIDGIEQIVKAKEVSVENRALEVSSVSLYDNEARQQVNQPISQPSESPASGSEMFDKFLQAIKG